MKKAVLLSNGRFETLHARQASSADEIGDVSNDLTDLLRTLFPGEAMLGGDEMHPPPFWLEEEPTESHSEVKVPRVRGNENDDLCVGELLQFLPDDRDRIPCFRQGSPPLWINMELGRDALRKHVVGLLARQ